MNNKKVISWILLFSMVTTVIILSWEQETLNAASGAEQFFSPSSAGFPQPYLVKDINTTTPSSYVHCPLALDELMLCSAHDEVHGWELWQSDGQKDGAAFVKDLVSGEESSSALRSGPWYARVNNEAFFGIEVYDAENVGAIWRTNGTTEGTTLVKDGFKGFDYYTPFANLGNLLVFSARRDEYGEELWRSDGTEAGTIMLTDDGTDYGRDIREFTTLGDKIYFLSNEPSTGTGGVLWISDGTVAGTSPLVNSSDPEMIGDVEAMVELNGKLILKKTVTGHGSSLWLSDGSDSVPTLISDLGGEDGTSAQELAGLDSVVLFTHYHNGDNKWGVGTTTGGSGETQYVYIDSPKKGSYDLTAAGSQAFFKQGTHPDDDESLWRTDGTAAGTYPLKRFEKWDDYYCPGDLFVVPPTIFFAANDGVHGCELWKSDGTVAGTVMLTDVIPGEQGSNPVPGVFFNGLLYFSASDRSGDVELWKTDGTESGTMLADDIRDTPSYSSMPDKLVAHPSGVYFAAVQGSRLGYDDWSVWDSDGTELGTRRVKSFGNIESEFVDKPTIFGGWQDWATAGEVLYFKVIDRSTWSTFDLWRSDGTEVGTAIVDGPSACASPGLQETVAGKIYFFADNWLCQVQTESSTVETLDYSGSTMTASGDSLLFFASGDRIGLSNGTADGTRQFAMPYVSPWYSEHETNYLTTIDDTLLFTGCSEPSENCELWRLQGPTGEPELVKDIRQGNHSSNPTNLVTGDDIVYFGVRLTDGGVDEGPIYELWKSDGTDEGTQSLAELHVCGNGAYSAGRLIIPGSDQYGYCELWISDGTVSGTHLLKDIVPDYEASSPEKLTVAKGYVFFTADDSIHGRELYVTDGTEDGTFMVADIVPGIGSSTPSGLTVAGNILFFSASSIEGEFTFKEQDRELWAVDLTKLPVVAGFSAEPTTGQPELEVAFKNHSIGSFNICKWDFGDGSKVESCDDQTHNYSNPGTFTVSLTVNGSGGNDTMTKTHYITVDAVDGQVEANFSASPMSGPSPLLTKFTNLSAGDFDECQWDFGDNNTYEACDDRSHTYNQAGTYSVSLTVDGLGGNDSMTKTDYITVYEPVNANFNASPSSGVPPIEVFFENLSTGDYDTCKWDFGVGLGSEVCNDPSVIYTEEGDHTVSLTVKGPGGEDMRTVEHCVKVGYQRIFLPGVMGKK